SDAPGRPRLWLERGESGYWLRDAATGDAVRWDDERLRVVKLAGSSYRLAALQDDSFAPGRRLALVPEPENEHDPHAVGIWDAERRLQAGYVPAEVAPGVRVDELRVGTFGFTFAGGWATPLNDYLGVSDAPEYALRWSLDADASVGRDQHGREVDLRPFLGVVGMPPPEAGVHPTSPPRRFGGNIDCTELVAGTTLYLPIPVDGALLSAGDGHARQGDGEVSQLA